MKLPPLRRLLPAFITLAATAIFLSFTQAAPPPPEARNKLIPEPLKTWSDWVTWDDADRDCPTPYHDAKKHLCFWPSRLALETDRAGARFDFEVTVFHDNAWIPLPGGAEAWPLEVKLNGQPVPVLEHNGVPSVQLPSGAQKLAGIFRWAQVPQRLAIPREIGILTLTMEGKPVDAPAWDASGLLWLKRDGSAEQADKDFLSLKIYSALEDGIPLWLRTEIELTVSGKSREEDLGTILPEGWKLTAVESPLPVAIDDAGRAKAQVRAGKWIVRVDAFRADNPTEIRYAPGEAKPAAEEQLLAFRAKPDFRLVEITGAPSIDVSQTTFPEKWRELPVYRWDTAAPLRLEERMRGMGQAKPAGLTINRELWLDENGRGLTFRDALSGTMQAIWRLDTAPGQDLGSVRNSGQGQLITRNPANAAAGVEIRTRNLNLDATGRMGRTREFSATGWQADADALKVTLNLPPGWRLFALFGADWVRGDWLTAWTLLDLFLLLVFTLAVFRLWGLLPAVLAFFAFGLSYHEADAPRFVWLLVLVPLALLRVVPETVRGRRALVFAKWLCVALFVLIVVPFLAQQIEQAIYPQLEIVRSRPWVSRLPGAPARIYTEAAAASANAAEAPPPELTVPEERTDEVARPQSSAPSYGGSSTVPRSRALPPQAKNENLLFDAKARIQTGPGVPEWHWRTVSFGWNGPVQAGQQVRPVLISLAVERLLTVLRIALVLMLSAILLGARGWGGRLLRPRSVTPPVKVARAMIFAVLGFGVASSAHAQSPAAATLELLRTRLLEPSDAYPNAADLPSVSLTLNDRRLTLEADVHTALRVAVPLPGRLPTWSPVSVFADGKPEAALRRDDGFLWVVLPAGVHRVRVEGQLSDANDWEWSYLLKPRLVKIDAPGWTWTGVRPDGVPEEQVFFSRQQKAPTTAGGAPAAAGYDRNDFQSLAVVERRLELGLVWQVRTTVSRLSPAGKALSLRVPLLEGESVLSANAVVRDGAIEVRLGAQETAFTWESSLAVTEHLKLETRAGDTWVERWILQASPVWNVALTGLAPIFEPSDPALVPVWQPWPGESVALTISRPEPVAGATVTVHRARHEIALGRRQRVSSLTLALRCSLGEDFFLEAPAEAEVTALTHNGAAIPVRKDGNRLIVPLRPGEQTVVVGWKINTPLGVRTRVEPVRLPVECANVSTVLTVPSDRWTLWADGPQRGPAVRFWGVLVCAVLAALVLGRLRLSPLSPLAWALLVVGLTQVWLPAALVVIAWLMLLAWRGDAAFSRLGVAAHNTLQLLLIVLTVISLGTLLVAAHEGLLGTPEMFISGNGSSRTALRWFQARCDGLLPQPGSVTVSIWWYRFFMLAWALWLAASLLRWLRWGWENFSSGGVFRRAARVQVRPVPPPLPTQP